jgi:hypothetical protein
MTMLDDDRLASLFARAGAAFDVPATGVEDIVARAAGAGRTAGDGDGRAGDGDGDRADGAPDEATPPGDGRVRRLVHTAGRHRVLSVAACVVVALLVAGTVGALVRSSAPARTSSLAQAGRVAPAPAPRVTTTIPSGDAVAGGSSGSSHAATAPAPAYSPAVTTPTAPPALPSGAVGQSSKIEQTGTLGLSVGRGDLTGTMTRLAALAGADGGFVASSQTQSGAGTGGAPSGTITLQVPVDDFASVVRQAQALGRTSGLTTKATDVTGQYVDLQSRLTALEDSRQQYLTILAKATTVGDVLAVQEQLDGIQSQIEQLQGQLNLLNGQTAYSTFTVDVTERATPARPGPGPEPGVVRAWHDSVGGFVAGVEGVIRLAGPVLFALLCLGVLWVGGRVLWRRYQRHNL